jgi:hypothetical protein
VSDEPGDLGHLHPAPIPLSLVGEPVSCQRCGRRWLPMKTGGYVAEVEGTADQCCVNLLIHLNGLG